MGVGRREEIDGFVFCDFTKVVVVTVEPRCGNRIHVTVSNVAIEHSREETTPGSLFDGGADLQHATGIEAVNETPPSFVAAVAGGIVPPSPASLAQSLRLGNGCTGVVRVALVFEVVSKGTEAQRTVVRPNVTVTHKPLVDAAVGMKADAALAPLCAVDVFHEFGQGEFTIGLP